MDSVEEWQKIGVEINALTSSAKGDAWGGGVSIYKIEGRTKTAYKDDEGAGIGKYAPLGTIFEFAVAVFLSACSQAIMEENCTFDRVKEIMLTSINDEITEREPYNGYLVYQGGVPEVETFVRTFRK